MDLCKQKYPCKYLNLAKNKSVCILASCAVSKVEGENGPEVYDRILDQYTPWVTTDTPPSYPPSYGDEVFERLMAQENERTRAEAEKRRFASESRREAREAEKVRRRKVTSPTAHWA